MHSIKLNKITVRVCISFQILIRINPICVLPYGSYVDYDAVTIVPINILYFTYSMFMLQVPVVDMYRLFLIMIFISLKILCAIKINLKALEES